MDKDVWNKNSSCTIGPSGSSSSSTSTAPVVGVKRPQPQSCPSQSDNPDGDEEARPEFSCPYCYEDYEIHVLCSHLDDEHCYESKVAVCPVCATKIWKDMAGHITQQHSQLFKLQRRRRFRRGAAASNATLSLLCKELREVHLQALLAPPLNTSTADSLLSTISPNPDNNSNGQIRLDVASLSPEERSDRLKEAALRAMFVQEIIVSTLYQ